MGPDKVPTLSGLGGTGVLESSIGELTSHEWRLIMGMLLNEFSRYNPGQFLIKFFTIQLGKCRQRAAVFTATVLLDNSLDLVYIVARLLVFFDAVGSRTRQLVSLTTQETLQCKVAAQHWGELSELTLFLAKGNIHT